ncbi:unnamed protein product [Allacma fusca]|uniref:Phosducin domain-containing protein n=1 Tax=Allacma fusca TaxID=39272 RepID=A0A8J2JYJ6_9HEXA|nr:unnamed protein product [Allacma fusca]
MQNPNEDTEWNDVLRSKGILPPKQETEITEDQIVSMLESTIEERTGTGRNLEKLSLDELDELEDEEEERILQEYKAKRMQEMKAQIAKSKFGEVLEITAQDYVQEINKAGEGIWVVLHLYKQGIPMCALLNQFMAQMAAKFPTTKFVKSISTVCIPNYPDKNVPTIFIYFEGEMKKQYIGPVSLRGTNLTLDEFEYLLGKVGAVKSTIEKDPKPKVRDNLMSQLGKGGDSDSDDY